ncbi:c-type cytochrome biogenesis protein CcmI [Nitrobacter winogradskyi]|uniref:Cytochrome c-type biogenesis protein CcmH n=2 Tax=Nitrobacter winogradskyi TaxID=913 RepID=A0ACC6AH68_NITWI|nr:c-type cytochrome biogenesis protein CcmI [Nitrobacter winogradskyi]MCP1998729.1 cytochrome c-type biogenesis protein CcmH [Nitrobacter winogradskyi]GEC14345.1 cytochrome c-type biogenesis protein CycH [Nitrobacter winogradskyi]
MTLWFVFALMTAGAAFAVLWPLGRSGSRRTSGGSETTVYRDQLAEVGRDAAAGLIGEAEAAAARVEIGRRLLEAADAERHQPPDSKLWLRRAVAVVALAGIPLLAFATYLPLGSPQLPDFPLAARIQTADASQSLDSLVARVESHLEKNPADGRGWTVLAPVLAKLGRFDGAARAYRNVITYEGETAPRRADLGAAIAGAANGIVTAEAKKEFERALALDPQEAKARFFLGMAAQQDGRGADAVKIWKALLVDAPADAEWRVTVQEALAQLGDGAPRPTEEAVAAASDMNESDRSAMIHTMVDRLAARLKQDGNDVEGWLRLARAYMVLNQPEKSRAVRDDARRALGQNEAGLRQLNEGFKALGIDG